MKKTNENDYVEKNPWGILIFLLLFAFLRFLTIFPSRLRLLHPVQVKPNIFLSQNLNLSFSQGKRVLWLISSLSWFWSRFSFLVFHSFHRNMPSGSAAEAAKKGIEIESHWNQHTKIESILEFHSWTEDKMKKKRIKLMKDSFSFVSKAIIWHFACWLWTFFFHSFPFLWHIGGVVGWWREDSRDTTIKMFKFQFQLFPLMMGRGGVDCGRGWGRRE